MRATAQNFPDFAQNLEICMRKPRFFSSSIFNLFYSFCLMIHTYYVIFCVTFALFLVQNFKIKF